jgi:hypothetical protein
MLLRCRVDADNPYRPPVSDAAVPQHEGDPGDRARLVAILLLVYVGAAAIVILSGLADAWMLLEAKDGRFLDEADVASVELRENGVMVVHAIAYIATVIVFGRFLVQANRNASTIAGTGLWHTPASMVWWYFVPVANLWKPYTATREVWDATTRRSGETPPWADLRLWWTFWIITTIADRVVSKMAESEDVDVLLTATWMNIGSSLMAIGAAMYARAWILALDATQRKALAELRP